MVQSPAPVAIDGRHTVPQVGSCVLVNDRIIGSKLLSGDDAVGSFPGCQFRIASSVQPAMEVACNVKVPGRTLQRRPNQEFNLWVKVRITWVGDGQPDSQSDGWLLVEARS